MKVNTNAPIGVYTQGGTQVDTPLVRGGESALLQNHILAEPTNGSHPTTTFDDAPLWDASKQMERSLEASVLKTKLNYARGGSPATQNLGQFPDPQGVPFYNGLVKGDGKMHKHIGSSQAIESWVRALRNILPSMVDKSQKLEQTKGAFIDTIKKESKDISQAMKKDLPKGIKEFNDRTNGEAFKLLEGYQGEQKSLEAATNRLNSALSKADAAQERVTVVDQKIEKLGLNRQKDTLAGERKSVEEKINQNNELIDLLSDADVKGMAKKLGKTVASAWLNSEHRTELIKIDAQIAHIDDQLAQVEDKALRTELTAAKKDLEAAFTDLAAASVEQSIHKTGAWGKLDQLAALEEVKGPTKMFREARDFYAKAAKTSRELYDQTSDYVRQLEGPVFGAAGKVREYVGGDRKFVDSEGGDRDGSWNAKAMETETYLGKVAAWQKGEVSAYKDLLRRLEKGEQFQPADQAIAAAMKALGATVDEKDVIIRP